MEFDKEKFFKTYEAFKDIEPNSLQLIIENSKLLSYKIGQRIVTEDHIPDNVIIILKGQARLINNTPKVKTICKLGTGNIIGISSILRLKASEEISAANELIGLAISDQTILDLYGRERTFREWCNSQIFPSEILALVNHLIIKSNRTDIDCLTAFNTVLKCCSLKSIEDNEVFKIKANQASFIASDKNEKFKIFSQIDEDSFIQSSTKFATRIISIPQSLYDNFYGLKENIGSNNKINSQDSKNIQQTISPAPLHPEKTSIDFGQNTKETSFKLIEASGDFQEAFATLQMLASFLDLPFRKDTIETILRGYLKKNSQQTMELMGSLIGLMSLSTTGGQIYSKDGCRLQTPSLIYWKNKFVLATESNKNGITIASPKDGWVHISPEEFTDEFGEYIKLILIQKSSTPKEKRFGLDWFLPALRRHKNTLIQVFIASFIVQLFTLANPLLIQVIIDKVINQRSLDTLQVLGIALVFVTILGGILSSLRTYLFSETTNRIDTRLGAEVIDHLLRLPLNYFDSRPVGELETRVAELEQIRNFLTGQALTTILDALFSLIYIVVMAIYSWLLTFIALGVVPIQILLTWIGTPLIRRQIREAAQSNAKTKSHLVEVLTGVQTVKAQNVETISRWKWQDLYGKYISRTFEKTITATALNETSKVFQQLSQLLVLWVGASLVLNGRLTLGQLIAFRIISGYVTTPLLRLSTIWQNVQELKVSFERLADIIDTNQESSESDKLNITIPPIKGNVRFENLSFRFHANKSDVLKNINLNIEAGKFVGVVGQSGSGKSTLMKLIPRLYEVNEGKIIVDQYDVSKVELYSLRRQIGIVPQEPLLFSGSISDNIALTNEGSSNQDIIDAAKSADAHDFIMNLPNGYSTNIGERGAGLSGGQKQRIAIARTLLAKPNLLIMDEATSALDYNTEKRVCDNLKSVYKGTTVFFITHRLNTIKNADEIIMLNQGEIDEVGSHEKLMETKGRYYALFKQQESI